MGVSVKASQCFALVHGDMIGLIALDLVLRIVLFRMMDIAFVVDVPGVHPNDVAADAACFGIPSYVVADFECLRHDLYSISWAGAAVVASRAERRKHLSARGRPEFKYCKEALFMQEYDLYINPQKPTLGLYVRTGAGLPDLADPKQWVFDSTLAWNELSSELVRKINANGHAFQELD